jgi:jouberin
VTRYGSFSKQASEKLIRLWDCPSEVLVRELAGREARVNSVVFAPDGKTLFSGDADGVRVVRATDSAERGIDGFARAKIVREQEIAKVRITHLEMGRSNFSQIVHTRDNMIRVFETKVMVSSQRHSLQRVPDDVNILAGEPVHPRRVGGRVGRALEDAEG